MACKTAVTVIIPTYNCAAYLPEAIDSVLQQSFTDFEIIVVDDGSTDRTPEILALYSSKITPIRQRNGGPSAARNTGLHHARGQYIAFLDADDIWRDDMLKRQVTYLQRHQWVDIVFTNYIPFGDPVDYETGFDLGTLRQLPKQQLSEDEFIIAKSNLFEEMLADLFLRMSTVMLRSRCIDTIGGFNENAGYPYDDWEFCLRLSKAFRFGYIDQCLLHRREIVPSRAWRRDTLAVLAKTALDNLEQRMDLTREEIRSLRLKRSCLATTAGYVNFDNGEFHQARQHFRTSLGVSFSTKALVYLILSYLPQETINALRSLKHRFRFSGIS